MAEITAFEAKVTFRKSRCKYDKEISQSTKDNILMSDDSVCPYTWDCIRPNGSVENISFNVDQYDDAEFISV